ncbi:MAG: enoyl-CoA hydratase-related protein [Rhizobiaceae bacterium]|nr:enoyl-CoA hydratase-related protein [Rhizobiaceae bacterium]
MQSNVLNYETADAVCTITLNRPDSLNSFNTELRLDLLKALEAAEADTSVRVIVLKGAGKGFCAGADLGEGVEVGVERQLKKEYKPCLMAIRNSSKPVIAQVHGPAAGIGAGFALACDIVIMTDTSYIYLAFAAISLIPDGGLNWHLYHALGPRKAFEIIAEGKRLTAEECLNYGMCNQVVSADDLEGAVAERAAKLASGAPLAQAAVKKVLNQMGTMGLGDAIDFEAEVQQPLSESEDCREAVAAFFRKEKPVFNGR